MSLQHCFISFMKILFIISNSFVSHLIFFQIISFILFFMCCFKILFLFNFIIYIVSLFEFFFVQCLSCFDYDPFTSMGVFVWCAIMSRLLCRIIECVWAHLDNIYLSRVEDSGRKWLGLCTTAWKYNKYCNTFCRCNFRIYRVRLLYRTHGGWRYRWWFSVICIQWGQI